MAGNISLVRGFLEIEKQSKENDDFYKRKIATLLYALQASYKGISREIYFSLPEWDPERISMLQEEPQSDRNEDEIFFDYETRDKFVDHHASHGWNKEINLDIIVSHNTEMLIDEKTYLDDGDFIQWVRNEGGMLKHLDVYLLKHINYPKLSSEGVTYFSGLLFAEKNSEEVYQKIKRVLTKFTLILKEKRILHSASIERPLMNEVLAYAEDSRPIWIKDHKHG